ncbi:MAG: hypothetical protein RL414_1241 [Actinomycetota bacterium]
MEHFGCVATAEPDRECDVEEIREFELDIGVDVGGESVEEVAFAEKEDCGDSDQEDVAAT